MVPRSSIIRAESIRQYPLLRDDGTVVTHRPEVDLREEQWRVGPGVLEVFTAVPGGQTEEQYLQAGGAVLWVVHGWWGNAAQNLPFLELMASRYGIMARAVSLPGHGGSPSWSRNWLGDYAPCLEQLLAMSADEPKVLLLHSGAAHWGERAMGRLSGGPVTRSVRAILYLAPVPEMGTALSTLRFFWKGVVMALTKFDHRGLIRFACQWKFWGEKKSLRALIDSPVSARHILFDTSTTEAFVTAFLPQLDDARYFEYLKASTVLAVAPLRVRHGVAQGRRHLFALGSDQNYSRPQLQVTAQHWGAAFQGIDGVPHQGLALESGRQRIAQFIAGVWPPGPG